MKNALEINDVDNLYDVYNNQSYIGKVIKTLDCGIITCTLRCKIDKSCHSVNVNNNIKKCELLEKPSYEEFQSKLVRKHLWAFVTPKFDKGKNFVKSVISFIFILNLTC